MEALNPNSPYEVFAADPAPRIETIRFAGEAIVEQVHAEHPEIEERGYQIDCLGALSGVRKLGENRALIHMATGLGKTTVAAMDVKQFLSTKPDARMLFVAHQNEILKQARGRFQHILGDNRAYGMFTGEGRQNKDADYVFASFQLLHTSRDAFQPDAFDYIVVDEGHHGKATTYEPSLLYFEPQFLLGMTATPDRRDLKEIREIFGEEVYSKPLDQALSERLLARPNYHVILDDISELLSQGPKRSIKAKEYKQLNRTLFIPKRDEEIAEIITKKVEGIERPKIIAFCPSVEHANRMADLLPNAAALHSKQSKPDRRATMDRFINNGLSTVTTVDLFNEGIDVADANVVVFLRSTESEVIFQQQLGRGLRKVPGKDSVLVLDFVASCDRLLMIDRVLGAHADNDDADIVFDRADDSDELYDLDFGVIRNRHEIDIERSDFSETTRQVLELLKSIDRRAATLTQAPEGWIALKSLVAARERARESDRLLGCVRALGLTAMRYIADDYRPSLHISAEDVPIVLERYEKLRSRADSKIDWSTYSNEELVELAQTLSPDSKLHIHQMKQLSQENAFPSWSYIAKRFGSVTSFQKVCGFEVVDRPSWKDWTDSEIIEYAKELSPDKPLVASEIAQLSKEGAFISQGPLVKRFGSMYEFHRQCGFEVKDNSKWKDISDEDILTHARALNPNEPFTTTTVQTLSKKGDFPSMNSISNRFGGINGLNARLGHDVIPRINWGELSDEQLAQVFLEIAPQNYLTGTEINTLSKEGKVPSRGYIESRFGSLREFYEQCGYETTPRTRKDWSELDRDALIQLALAASPDKPITEKLLNEYTKEGLMPSKGIIKRLIGGLTELQIATGFPPSTGTAVKLDRDDIITMAKELSPDLTLTDSRIRELYKEGRLPSTDVIRHRFGSIRAFQEATWG